MVCHLLKLLGVIPTQLIWLLRVPIGSALLPEGVWVTSSYPRDCSVKFLKTAGSGNDQLFSFIKDRPGKGTECFVIVHSIKVRKFELDQVTLLYIVDTHCIRLTLIRAAGGFYDS